MPASSRQRLPASEAERASLRALKNWLLAAPDENPLADQLVQMRLSAAIAEVMERAHSDGMSRHTRSAH